MVTEWTGRTIYLQTLNRFHLWLNWIQKHIPHTYFHFYMVTEWTGRTIYLQTLNRLHLWLNWIQKHIPHTYFHFYMVAEQAYFTFFVVAVSLSRSYGHTFTTAIIYWLLVCITSDLTRSQNCEKRLLVSSCLYFRPSSVHMEQLCFYWTDVYEILYLRIFRKFVEKIKFLLKSVKSKG